jgi:hypothetical protein
MNYGKLRKRSKWAGVRSQKKTGFRLEGRNDTDLHRLALPNTDIDEQKEFEI